jgi:ATP phosphoribosyltransferase regulatory subunit
MCGDTEPATGMTLFPDAVLRAAPRRLGRPRVYLPAGADPAKAAALRGEGFATVAGLEPVTDAAAEARRLGCTHLLRDDAAESLNPGG